MALGRIYEIKKRTGLWPELGSSHTSLAAASAALNIFLVKRHLSDKGKVALARRIAGMLRHENGLGPLLFELETALNLRLRGWQVQHADLEGTGRFDLLATKAGHEIECECKLVSSDIGMKVHLRDMQELQRIIDPALEDLRGRPGGHLVDILVADRLGKSRETHQRIAALCALAIANERAHDSETEVTYRSFDPGPLERLRQLTSAQMQSWAHKTVEEQTGAQNAMALFHVTKEGAAILIPVRSRLPNKMIEGIYQQLKTDADKQFTKTKPGFLFVRIAGLGNDEVIRLGSVKRDKPNQLQQIANGLLQKRPHLHTISFIGREQFSPIPGGHTTEGPAFSFVNPHHRDARKLLLKLT